MVPWIRHINFDKDHLRICIAESWVIEHHEPLRRFGVRWHRRNVTRLLFELPDSAGGRVFAFVDQTAGEFNGDLVERGPELFLQEERFAGCGLGEDSNGSDAVCF